MDDPDVKAINQLLGEQNTSDPDVANINSLLGKGEQDSQTSSNPWENFKQTAQKVITERGLPSGVLPVLLGQAAVESARGQAAPGDNFFGIKGQGTAGANNLTTQEYGNGSYYGENSDFAAYNNPEESINAYLDLISGYKGVPEAMQTNDPDAIIKAIEANGYATSPTYVQTIEGTPEFQGGTN